MDCRPSQSQTAQLLHEYLEAADRSGRLPIHRGAISRNRICKELKIPRAWTKCGPVKDVLFEFDTILDARGYCRSRFDGLLTTVRQFLEQGLDEDRIPIAGGKINRTALRERFALPSGVFSRHPGMGKLIAEFDAKLAEKNVQKSKYEEHVEPLRLLIADYREGRKPIPMFGARLNRRALGRILGLPAGRLVTVSRLREIMDEADEYLANREGTYQEEHSRKGLRVVRTHLVLRIAHHKKSWDFNQLADQFSETLALNVGHAFIRFCSGTSESTTRAKHAILLNIFGWLHCNSTIYPGIVESLRKAECPNLDEFEWACNSWREGQAKLSGSTKEATSYNKINTASGVLRNLATAGIVPSIRDLRPPDGSKARTRPLKSVAEISRISTVAGNALRTAARANEIEISTEDETAFLSVLEEEAQLRADLPSDTVAAIRVILSDRLATMRQCAVSDFLRWTEHFDKGQQLLADVDMAATTIEELAYSSAESSYLRSRDLGWAFPRGRSDLAMARFLALVDHRWAGCPPRGQALTTMQDRGSFYGKFYSKNGGFKHVSAMMNAHDDAVIATLILYLIDSGANVSTARTLFKDCLEPSDVPGHKRISGYKARSEGKVIFSDLPVKSRDLGVTTIQAVEKLADMTARYRLCAEGDDAMNLFLVQPQSKVILLPEYLLRSMFKSFCNRHTQLNGLKLLPSMIRPSVLLDLALSKDGNLIAAQYRAHHADQSLTDGYTRKWPMRLLYEEKMKFFMRQWQAVAAAPIAGAADRLGISISEMDDLLAHAERNGLGTLCIKPKAGIQPGTRKGELCHFTDRCLGCSAQIVVPEPEALADMLIFHGELQEAQERYESEQPERWERVWLPWLAFTEVVIEGMSKGPQAAVLREARNIATSRREDPSYISLRPW